MDKILLALVKASVAFSLFFLVLYFVVSEIRPVSDSAAVMLSVSDVLWIGSMFVSVGVSSLLALVVHTIVSRHRSRESAVARLEESTQALPTIGE